MEELIPTLQEQDEERIDTLQENSIIAGVQTINGKAGDLNLKTINNQDLLTTGNLSLATTEQLATKQDALTGTQLTAVNSGIDSAKVGQITTNANNITALQNGKQDNLTQTQLNAVNSGIDETKVAQIATNTENIASNTGRITTIEGKIPSAATSTNQLTDKAYVDNSIATNTANYISDNGQPFQSLADLEAYSGPLTNNDYAFVVSTDAAGNLLYTRYKYNADQELWAEEYTIANPTFTSTQWAAIDSGVTANDVTQIGTNKSDIAGLQSGKQDALSQTQLDAVNSGIDATKVQQIADNTTAIATKQDELIAGTNIQIASDGKTISATDTTYTAGTGLTLTGTQFSVNEPAPSGFFTDTTSTATGTGSTINLTGTGEAVLDSVKLAGDTYQQTYSGKNLLNVPDGTNSRNNIEISSSSGRIRFRNTGTTNYGAFGVDGALRNANYGDYITWNNLTLPAGTYSLSYFYDSGSTTTTTVVGHGIRVIVYGRPVGSTDRLTENIAQVYVLEENASVTFTTTENKEVNIVVYEYGANETFDLRFRLQLEKSPTPTEYEPYVGGIPAPNPDYPQDIEVVTGNQTVQFWGKNLFNKNATIETRYIDSNGAWADPGTASYINQDYSIGGGVDISFSFSSKVGGAYVRVAEYKPDGTFIQRSLVSSESTLTTDSNTAKVIFSTNAGSSIYFDSLQIELASSPTTYTPYQGQSYNIDLGSIELCKIGDYQDYIWKDGDTWKIHKATATITLDGTNATWNTASGGFVCNYNSNSPFYGILALGAPSYQSKCEQFTFQTDGTTWTGVGKCGFNSSGTFWLMHTDTSITSATRLNTWLGSNNTNIYCPLAVATDTIVTDSALIAQLEALANAQSYNPITNINSSTPAPNLPTILTVDVFKNNWVGTLAGYNEELKRLADKIISLEASL